MGGGVNFFPFWGQFGLPRFILSISIIHKWGELWFYHSQQMKNSTIFQQMYLSISKSIPASRSVATSNNYNLVHCFQCSVFIPSEQTQPNIYMSMYMYEQLNWAG